MASTYKHVIFDLYGTLIRIYTDFHDPAVWVHLSYQFAAYGADYTPKALEEAYNRLLKDENRRLALKNGSE